MPLSVTCQCGAKLEIDDAFVGKAIPCPDCSRPLPTTPVVTPVVAPAPPAPPPLDLPDFRRTSPLAVYSLAISLVLGFVGGGIVGIALGVLALRDIARRPGKLTGAKLAKAGILVGAVLTLLTVVQYLLPSVGGIDQLLREFKFVDRLLHTNSDVYKVASHQRDLTVARPSRAWAMLKPPSKLPDSVLADEIILVNTARDAYISFQSILPDNEDNDVKARLKKVIERFQKSELVNLLGAFDGNLPTGDMPDLKGKDDPLRHVYEATFDLRLAGKQRRFLLQFPTKGVDRYTVKVAAAPRGQFERLEEDFRKAFRKPE